ncbi:lytic transglycosylase domain-containing protein [Parvibaculum sp.]|uniref:lytic transglycosylase domain-containing protein n=1 Tax=Parvibaculum sp. TaxID=2024848 RepID=UPI00320E75EE
MRPEFMNWNESLSAPERDRRPNRAKPRRSPRVAHLLILMLGACLAFGPASFAAAETSATTPHKTTSKAHTKKPAEKAASKAKTASKKSTAKKSAKKTASKKTAKSKTAAKKPTPKRHLAVVSSTLLTKADLAALNDAYAEADRGNWPEAMRHAGRIADPTAAKLVLWSRLVAQDSGATLAEIVAFQQQNPDWPRQALLSRRAEEALLAFSMSDQDVLNWFGDHPPVTGEGRLRYGKALAANGRNDEAREWIQRAWVENDFTLARQKEILSGFRPYLTAATHKARLDRLLFDERSADARATAALIGADAQKLADARIKLMTRSTLAPGALSSLPSSLRSDPGLIYDQIRYERRQGNDEKTVTLVMTAPSAPHAMVDADAWWIERKIAARKALAVGQYKQAYQIVSQHGLKTGADFAEAEFMSGWIALQYLNNANTALSHFARLNDAVSTPISKARAEYWCGRAAEAARDKTVAELYYRKASTYPTTFYGQLGTAALAGMNGGTARLHLPKDPAPTAGAKASFEKLELVHATKVLHDLGRTDQMWSFMLHLADILDDRGELAELSDLALKYDEPKLALRIAKAAAQRNIVLPQRAYPVARMPEYRVKGPTVEKALVYGLSRQESEFDAGVVSPAGARGLMQLMPGTAKLVAKQIKVPYSADRLTSDPSYNAMLGSAHLGDLIENYSGSYIMSVAAYNAGGSRVGEWVDQFGDPRSGTVDPIDWIENIPFSETRNYVQRVMENTEIYRTRLTGQPGKIRLEEDLRRRNGGPIPVIAKTPPADGGDMALSPSLALPSTAMAPVADDEDRPADAKPVKEAVADADTAPTPRPIAPNRTHSKQ